MYTHWLRPGASLLVARRAGEPVAFALGFLGWERGVHLHSHQVGVVDGLRGSGVGLAMKLAQFRATQTEKARNMSLPL